MNVNLKSPPLLVSNDICDFLMLGQRGNLLLVGAGGFSHGNRPGSIVERIKSLSKVNNQEIYDES